MLARDFIPALKFGHKIHNSDILGGGFGTTGNVYWVKQTAASEYNAFKREYNVTYKDGTESVRTTIQAGLDATTANKDDYVLVTPDNSDYDSVAALTMSKSRVHLIAPAGLGHRGFPSNAVRMHQNTSATDCITVSADTVEIAGFFFKGYLGADIIGLGSATRWHPHIHDNFFGMSATDASENYGIKATGACSHFSIHDNFFTNYSPGAMSGTDNDLGSFIYFSSASCTRGLIRENIIYTGHNTEVTAAIQYSGCGCFIIDNFLAETAAHGASEAGVLTLGINVAADNILMRNLVAMTTANIANAINGMDSDNAVMNYGSDAAGGDTILS